jgi:hypothetical protein
MMGRRSILDEFRLEVAIAHGKSIVPPSQSCGSPKAIGIRTIDRTRFVANRVRQELIN